MKRPGFIAVQATGYQNVSCKGWPNGLKRQYSDDATDVMNFGSNGRDHFRSFKPEAYAFCSQPDLLVDSPLGQVNIV